MRSIVSRPRAASRRSPLAVIEPSGNASAAATLNRIGSLSAISACVMLAERRTILFSSPDLPALTRRRLFLRRQKLLVRVLVGGRVIVRKPDLRSLRGPAQVLPRCLHSFGPFFWRWQLERQTQKTGDYAIHGNAEVLRPDGISGPIWMDSLKDHSGVKKSQELSADVGAKMRLGYSVVMKGPLKSVLDFLGNSAASLRR